MRARTTAATIAAVTLLALAGCLGGLSFGGHGGLTAAWHSDTPLRAGGSHHPAAVARFGGETYVAAGLGDVGPNRTCGFAVTNATGSIRWNRTIPRDACGTQPAGDPTFGDVTGDGRPEVVWATREGRLYAANATTGALAMNASLPTEDVFVAPVVVHRPALVVAPMMNGAVRAYRPNGSVAWSRTFAHHLRGQEPAVVRTANGTRELLLGTDGGLAALDPATGRVRWRNDAPARFLRVGHVDGRPVAVATGENANGTVGGASSHVAAYAPNGTRLWRHALPGTAAVGAVGRPTPDAAPLAYVTDNHGTLRAYDATTGRERWNRTLAGRKHYVPPPTLVALDGSTKRLAVTTADGPLLALNATDGSRVASWSWANDSVAVWAGLRHADLRGTGREDVVAVNTNGRIVAVRAT